MSAIDSSAHSAIHYRNEADRRLSAALHEAGRSALGMPGTVDTFNEWLKRHGLALVLTEVRR